MFNKMQNFVSSCTLLSAGQEVFDPLMRQGVFFFFGNSGILYDRGIYHTHHKEGTTMKKVVKRSLKEIVRLLDEFGADYAIVVQGRKFGNLEAVSDSVGDNVRRPRGYWTEIRDEIRKELLKLKIKKVVYFKCPTSEDLLKFALQVQREARNALGPGKVMWESNTNSVTRQVSIKRLL